MFEWTNKKCKNFNIFSKKVIKTNTWKYHYFTTVYQKSWWFDLQFLRYWAWKTEIGNFGSFFAFLVHPPQKKRKKIEKSEFPKNEKNAWYIIILHMCTKDHNHLICFLRYKSLFYRYHCGRCWSELVELVPLPYSRDRSTHYSDRLHNFSINIPRC